MPGGSLDKMIRTVKKGNSNNKGGLDLDTVRCYGYQILSGLVYLHGENIGKYFKRKRACIAYMESTVVDISMTHPSFKPNSLF